MSRYVLLTLALAMVGCAQHAVPFAATGSQPTMPNAGATAARPAESVIAHVAFKNEAFNPAGYSTEVAIYWSYAANPLWHVQLRECVKPGDEIHTDVVYNHITSGPQIKFTTELASKEIFHCSLFRAGHRAIAFHSMIFDPDARFHVVYRSTVDYRRRKLEDVTLCARGGGHNEVCKTGPP